MARPSRSNMVDPARLDSVQANDTCLQCHSQGRPLHNPIEGKYYDWPLGFMSAKSYKTTGSWKEHELGETTYAFCQPYGA